MSKKPIPKQSFEVDVIKTPEGQVPTVDSFHRVIDGLFGEVLDTRKDIVKLIPNLENELNNMREVLAQQMVLFEILNSSIKNLEEEVKEQGKKLGKLQKIPTEPSQSTIAEADLTEQSKKAIAKLIQIELHEGTKPIYTSLKVLEDEITKANVNTLKKVEKQLDNIKDQIDDLSSKTELQMLEILETINPSPVKSATSSSSESKSATKRKLPS
ncbi:MAG: hypothetical protein JXA54_04575 [Candidatus Heimdallarchaeota archaeon]|nr:hypothetical protein [Candidatus Heimdallarchaeota archaeon]